MYIHIYIHIVYIYKKEEWVTRDKTLMKWENLIEANRATGAGKNVGIVLIIIRNPGWSVFGSIAFIPIYSMYQKRDLKKETKRVE